MVRVSYMQGRHRRGWDQYLCHMTMSGMLLTLSACGGKVAPDAPLDWWHSLEGGVIAGQRPPPPGASDPYPNLATVPAKPVPTDLATRQRIADSLAAQRDRTKAQAALDPLPTAASVRPPPPASPPAASTPAASPPKLGPDVSRMTVDAVTPPPATPTPSLDTVPKPVAAAVSGELPLVPQEPPALPTVEGYRTPVAPPATPAVAAAPAPVVNGVQIAFTPGSSTLPPSASLTLRTFALAHRGVALAVVGHGENVRPDADAQGRSLELALKRAQAIAASLGEAGVPAVNLRLSAEAAGPGGLARLN